MCLVGASDQSPQLQLLHTPANPRHTRQQQITAKQHESREEARASSRSRLGGAGSGSHQVCWRSAAARERTPKGKHLKIQPKSLIRAFVSSSLPPSQTLSRKVQAAFKSLADAQPHMHTEILI